MTLDEIIFILFSALAFLLSGLMVWYYLRAKYYLKKIRWIEKHEYPEWQKVNLEELLPCLKPYITPSLLKTQQGRELQEAFELAINKKKYGKEVSFGYFSNKFSESTIQRNIDVFLYNSSASTAQKLFVVSSCIKVYRDLMAEETEYIPIIISAFTCTLTIIGVCVSVATFVKQCSGGLQYYDGGSFFVDF